jgi:hypothetical protein
MEAAYTFRSWEAEDAGKARDSPTHIRPMKESTSLSSVYIGGGMGIHIKNWDPSQSIKIIRKDKGNS